MCHHKLLLKLVISYMFKNTSRVFKITTVSLDKAQLLLLILDG